MAIRLKKEELDLIKSIITKHLTGIKVMVFGSRVKAKSQKYSDLDLALKKEDPIPLSTLTKLSEDFSECSLPFKVELVDWQRISPEFQQEILKLHERII